VLDASASGTTPGWHLYPQVVFTKPELQAVAVSKTSVSCYWSPVPNAIGYNVYATSRKNCEDFARPLNAVPVSTIARGATKLVYTETGLRTGAPRYYKVRAVYKNPVTGDYTVGNPSVEDSDIPTANAVPWGSADPNKVLDVIRAQYRGTDLGRSPGWTIVGPDGRVYQSAGG
jgi:hypothetical protein